MAILLVSSVVEMSSLIVLTVLNNYITLPDGIARKLARSFLMGIPPGHVGSYAAFYYQNIALEYEVL